LIEKDRLVFVGGDPIGEEEYLLEGLDNMADDAVLTLDGEAITKAKKLLNTFFSPVVFIITLVASIFGYLISALFYSLFALIIKMFLNSKLEFGSLYCISVYALTLMNLVMTLGLFVPFINFPFRFIFLLVATLFYIYGGVAVNNESTSETD